MQGHAEVYVSRPSLWLGGRESGRKLPTLPVGDGHETGAKTSVLRIVIVEDEPFVRLDIEQALKNAGHHVIGMADAADAAVALVDREPPDVVIMDVRLRGTRDGVDAAIEIWERFGIRSIFASANLDAAQRARAAAANPLGFVDKPFRSGTLIAALPSKA